MEIYEQEESWKEEKESISQAGSQKKNGDIL